MTITPNQARELLDGATPGPWRSEYDNEIIETNTSIVLYNTDGAVGWGHNIEHDVPLIAAAPDLAQTIAGMTEEWGVEADGNALFPVNEELHPSGEYLTECRADAEGVRDRMAKLNPHVRYRLVRRLVGPVEVVE